MRNCNHRLNESYFNDTSSEELADDVIATSIEANDEAVNNEVFNNNDKDNCIILSYEMKGTKDMKTLKEQIGRWQRIVFYAIDNLNLFEDDDNFFVMIRFPYPNDHHPIYYGYGMGWRDNIVIKNMRSAKAGEVFDKLIDDYVGKRDTNKTIFFDLLIGYDNNDNNVKQEYSFWKRVNKFRAYIFKSLSKIAKNKCKHWINVGFGEKGGKKKYYSVKTSNNLEFIAPEGYRTLLSSQDRFNNPDDLEMINGFVDGMKSDVGSEIPYEFSSLIKPKNLEWLKAVGLRMRKNGDVLECSFYEKATVNIFHLLHVWYYGRLCCKKIDCSEIKIDVLGTLELGTDLQERRFRKEWWTNECTVSVDKLIINSLKSADLQRVLKTMNVKLCDITRIGGLSNAQKRWVNLNHNEWMNPDTELRSQVDDIIYDNNRIILNKK